MARTSLATHSWLHRLYLILIQHNFLCVQKGDHVTNYWKMPINLLHTVPLKSKLTVTRGLFSSFKDQGLSFKFRVENYYEIVMYTF